MREQNYNNHIRLHPVWHYLVSVLLIALLGGSINYLMSAGESSRYPAALLLLISVILIFIYWYARAFALRAQDRAIRAEERLRHYLLTGQPMDPDLRMGQIIALRFASEEEYPALAKRAVAEKLSQKEIKRSIKNWKADHYRV